MHRSPAPDSPVAAGVFGVVKSWLLSWSEGLRLRPLVGRIVAAEEGLAASCTARVLVVDDNPVNRMVLSAQLQSMGLEAVLAADGAEAVALACDWPFDLILMDLQMPVLDGWQARVAIRRFEQGGWRPAVPVLACSLCSPAAAELRAYGLNGRLPKPCGLQELQECLRHWCPGYRPTPMAPAPASDSGLRQIQARASGTARATRDNRDTRPWSR